jgi:hypothetical protein
MKLLFPEKPFEMRDTLKNEIDAALGEGKSKGDIADQVDVLAEFFFDLAEAMRHSIERGAPFDDWYMVQTLRFLCVDGAEPTNSAEHVAAKMEAAE